MRIYLEDIVKKKQETVKNKNYDIEALKKQCQEVQARPSFYKALKRDGLSIIGEIKKASPSKGLIRADFKPVELASIYEGSVDAISVLTEEDFFMGHDDYLKAVSDHVVLPTLCKDFIISEGQIYQAKALGASAVLLIVAILSDEALQRYRDLAESLGMDALIEVHTKEELSRALKVKPKIIGINNRNLKTFEIDLRTSVTLSKQIPKDVAVICESGVFGPEEIEILNQGRYDAILVGESFMRSDDMVALATTLKAAYQQ